eukprot:TRINITY_DN407_c0_g1_i2.p2 TRINITY_DN407_c0_g1~~TRINITY_DN407_c0_g1_i2.p2  ORF type:complete len:110 (-),score=30.77 TRINITY_DN407_c0_g1_i2:248-577(-)
MTWVCFLKNLPESVVLSHFRVLLLTMSLHENEEDKRKVLDTLKIMKRGMDDLGVFLEELANQAECLDAAQKEIRQVFDNWDTVFQLMDPTAEWVEYPPFVNEESETSTH